MKKYILPVLALCAASFTACENADKTFPDFEGGVSVYFAYQYPVRTIELGEDNEINTDLDNAHKFQIVSAMGGAYKGKNIKVNIKVDESLCENLYFADGTPVKPMPSSYYSIANTTLDYAGGYMGKAEVQLSDAFFADPLTIGTTYVIPVVMTDQTGADHILSGTKLDENSNPSRTNAAAWDVKPMDYALWCVRYVNPWNGTYIVKEGNKEIDKTNKRVAVNTLSMNECRYTNVNGETVKLTFSGNNCTVSSLNPTDVVSGNGEFKKKSEIKAWGDKDRDALYLQYTVNGNSYNETLVAQVRTTEGDAFNTVVEFVPEYKK